MKKNKIKEIADRYAKVVEWSDEDGCFVGRVPALGYGGVHGPDRSQVFEEICQVAEEIVALRLEDGRKLPAPAGRRYSGKFVLRIPPGLHEALALEAEKSGRSLNAAAEYAIRHGLTAS
ncbi:MAG: toxin-antitoxin system HicB family antitoxin [Terrimicrobiaceae bacterium]